MKRIKRAFPVLLASFVLALVLAPCISAANIKIEITNPYENVNWAQYGQYRTQLHTHTTASDGADTLAAVVEAYYAAGYHALAITDHGTVDRGWINPNYRPFDLFFGNIGRWFTRDEPRVIQGLMQERYDEIKAGAGREDSRGMIRVPFGIEQNPGGNDFKGGLIHTNSWFADWGNAFPGGYMDYSVALRGIDKAGGLSIINHPTSALGSWNIPFEDVYEGNNNYLVNKIQREFERFDSLIGMEITGGHDRKLWDILLTNLAPGGRNVFAVPTDDTHGVEHWLDWGWVMALMEKNNAANLYDSLKGGAFFGGDRCISHPALLAFLQEHVELALSEWGCWDGEHGAAEPTINAITVKGSTISIEADAELIWWVADGEIIAIGDEINLIENLDRIGAYVRAELWSEGAILYTQPFLLSYEGMPSGRPVPGHFRDIGDVIGFFRMFMYPFALMMDWIWGFIK